MMKIKIILLAWCTMLLTLNGAVFGQATDSVPQVTTGRYEIYNDYDEIAGLQLAIKLEQLFNFFNQYFGFDPSLIEDKLRVRFFSSKSAFDRYVADIAGSSFDHFVFLDYNTNALNELLLFPQQENFDQLLAHYAFVQFLESHIPSPPLWIREGYALYFENSVYNSADDVVVFRENNAWLDRLKAIINDDTLIDLDTLFAMEYADVQNNRAVFYPQAWGIINFLAAYREQGNDNLAQEINRALNSKNSEGDNIRAAKSVIEQNVSITDLEQKFTQYILERQSFRDTVVQAIQHYTDQRIDDAERAFYRAIAVDNTQYAPYYYLGLIFYEQDKYSTAEHFYIESLARGADEATVYYALGLNALANSALESAEAYFDQAKNKNPEFAVKIETIYEMLKEN